MLQTDILGRDRIILEFYFWLAPSFWNHLYIKSEATWADSFLYIVDSGFPGMAPRKSSADWIQICFSCNTQQDLQR